MEIRDRILKGLTTSQEEAVRCIEGPLLILAGAGSGKTKVITHRIGYMIAEGISPEEIVAVTFTNKAANEMLERVENLLGDWIKGRPHISTFHSFCAKILRIYGEHIGIASNFTIYDTADVGRLIKSICSEVILPEGLTPGKIANIISYLKTRCIGPEEIEKVVERSSYTVSTLKKVYAKYEKRMSENNGLDFSDLLIKAIKLLEVSEAKEKIQRRYRYLLIDEYQDTNRLQYLLANKLIEHTRNICATGDPDQSIYSWRGADIRNILDFEKDYPDAKILFLENNFRSTGIILQAANSLIKHNKDRKEKVLVPVKGRGDKIKVFECEDELDEVNRVVEIIKEVRRSGIPYSEIAVMSRVNVLFGNIERGLAVEEIPYQLARGVGFFQRKEIKDVLAYMRVLVNPNDQISLERIINTPARGIGAQAQGTLKRYAEINMISLYQAVMQASEIEELGKSKENVIRFANLITHLKDMVSRTKSVKEIVKEIITQTGLYEYYRMQGLKANRPDEVSPSAYLDEFVEIAEGYEEEAEEGVSLEDFLSQLALVSDIDTMNLNEDRVNLLTMHSAKGLEFEVVIIIGAEENIIPHVLSLNSIGGKEIEEERRLFFVAITRAKSRVYICWANRRSSRSSSFRFNSPSRFLKEIDPQTIEGLDLSYFEQRQTRYQFTIAPKKPIQESAMKSSDRPKCPFKPGQRVYHPRFGYGVVQEIYLNGANYNAHIHFVNVGFKKLVIGVAPLQSVE